MQALKKEFLKFFSLISLPRGPRLAFGKVSFFNFSGEFFVEGLDHSPLQRPVFYFFWEILCRGLWPRPSAKTYLLFVFWISLPRAMVKALGKVQRNLKKNCFFIFIQTKDKYIYIPSHRSTTSTYISRTSHIYITNIMYVHPVVHKFTKSNQSFKPPTRTHRCENSPSSPTVLPLRRGWCVEGSRVWWRTRRVIGSRCRLRLHKQLDVYVRLQ